MKLTKEENLQVEAKVLQATLRPMKNGVFTDIRAITLGGEIIPIKIWAERKDITQGSVYRFKGTVKDFKGLYLSVDSVSESPLIAESFPTEGPLSISKLKEEVKAKILSIKNKDLQDLLVFSLKKLPTYFSSFAALGVHHNYEGGLATHSLSMSNFAESVASLYSLDRDLLVTAALIHDAGKTQELDVNGTYTLDGRLYGHIILMNDVITEFVLTERNGVYSDSLKEIKHLVLSHHGRLEWGSPVLGMTREAIAFHLIDKMDADMEVSRKALVSTGDKELTDKVWALDNRVLTKFDKED